MIIHNFEDWKIFCKGTGFITLNIGVIGNDLGKDSVVTITIENTVFMGLYFGIFRYRICHDCIKIFDFNSNLIKRTEYKVREELEEE